MLPPRKVQFERRISIPQLQVRRALSGGYGGCLCQWELKAPTDRSQSDCVHEQVAKEDCECPIYKREICIVGCVIPYRTISSVIEEHILIWKKQTKASRNDLFAFYCLWFG